MKSIRLTIHFSAYKAIHCVINLDLTKIHKTQNKKKRGEFFLENQFTRIELRNGFARSKQSGKGTSTSSKSLTVV